MSVSAQTKRKDLFSLSGVYFSCNYTRYSRVREHQHILSFLPGNICPPSIAASLWVSVGFDQLTDVTVEEYYICLSLKCLELLQQNVEGHWSVCPTVSRV